MGSGRTDPSRGGTALGTADRLAARAALRDLVDESTADGGSAGKHAKRLARYAGAKRTFALRMANYLGTREPRRAVKCATCANLLHFRHWLDHDRLSLVGGYFCGQWKLCLTCAIKRGAKGLGELVPVLVDQLQRDPRLRAYLVTLTVKDAPDMSAESCRENFQHLRASLRRYMERRNDAAKKERGYVEANKAHGIHWSIEGGRGKGSGGWHWHVHAAWIGHYRPNSDKLSDEWRAITGESYIVHVREFDCTKRCGARTSEAIAKDVAEVCKYTLKPHEMTPADAYTAHTTTQGKHFVGRLGTLRLSAVERERIEREQSPQLVGRYMDLFYRYSERAGRYQEIDGGWTLGAAMPDGLGGDPVRTAGAREVNAQLAPGDRAQLAGALATRGEYLDDPFTAAPAAPGSAMWWGRARSCASRGARGASPELDTRTILGDTGEPPDPGPPPPPSRSARIAAPVDSGEDLFATG